MRSYLNLIIGALVCFTLTSFIYRQPRVATSGDESTVEITGSIADQSNVQECGTDEIIRRNPFLQQKYAERVACAPEVDLDTAQVITIPVVIHILHLGEAIGEGTNISNEQAESCIRNLNERFRGDVEAMAAYVDYYGNAQLDEDELALVIDSKIEFCLAARDPENLPTNGIIRHDCSDLSYTNNFSGQSSTAYYAEKGISSGSIYDIPLTGVPDDIIKQQFHWPVDEYFNFYVVSEINGNNAGNGIQGYSYVGSMGTGATGYKYGPVCLYNVTGDTGTLKAGRAMNATWVHEIGHALNLYHTFGYVGDDCSPESNPCSQGDQVPDTPPTSSNTSCNFPSCDDAMVENYMDYTPESCRVAFTQGQIERMRDEIWTGLPYLVNNVSCQSPNDNDLAISSVSLPDAWCQPTIDFNVNISNFGGSEVSGASVSINDELYASLPNIEAGETFVLLVEDFLVGSGDFEISLEWAEDDYQDNNFYYAYVEPNSGVWTQFTMNTDVWANEIEWQITNESGQVVLEEDNYSFGENTYLYELCLPEGCYTFTITDSNGDGVCAFDLNNDGLCDIGGSFNLVVGGAEMLSISEPDEQDFGSELVFDFCAVDCPSMECQGDFDQDGVVDVRDLIIMLSNVTGVIEDCSDYDFNNDFQIDVQDVIMFLTVYGMDCFTGEIMLDQQPPSWVDNWIERTLHGQDLSISDIRELQDNNFEVVETVVYDLNGRKINRPEEELSTGTYLIVRYGRNGEYDVKKIFIDR